MDLIGRDFLTLLDFTPGRDRQHCLDLAAELKAKEEGRTSPTIRCAARTWR